MLESAATMAAKPEVEERGCLDGEPTGTESGGNKESLELHWSPRTDREESGLLSHADSVLQITFSVISPAPLFERQEVATSPNSHNSVAKSDWVARFPALLENLLSVGPLLGDLQCH